MRNWLADNEQVIIRCRPHSRILVWPITVGILMVAATAAALAKLQASEFEKWAPDARVFREPLIVLLLSAVILLQVSYPVRRVIRWANTWYILTSHRFIVRRGRLRRHQVDIQLEAVERVEMRQKLRQRVVGAGQLEFYMMNGGHRTIADVPYVAAFKNETDEAWTQLFRGTLAQTPSLGYYADEDDLTGKELPQLGADY